MMKVLLSGSLILLAAVAPQTPAKVQSPLPSALPSTGLRLASRAQLRRVPKAELPYSGARPLLRVDLSEHMPPPGFQGKQSSCAAWATAYAVKTYQEKLEGHYSLFRSGRLDLHHVFSPAFVYNQLNSKKEDDGISLVQALTLLSDRGTVSLAEMPYNIDDHTRQPSKALLSQARRFRIASYSKLDHRNQLELKSQLQAGYPVMIGAHVDQSFVRLRSNIIWQHSSGKKIGPHALVLVGYDDGRHAFKIMNSWGTGWSDHGFGWIDYQQMKTVIIDAYIAKDAPNNQPGRMAYFQHERGTPPAKPWPETPTSGTGPDGVVPASPTPQPGHPDPKQDDKKAGGDTDGEIGHHRHIGQTNLPSQSSPAPSVHISQEPVDLANNDSNDVIEQAEENSFEPLTLQRQRIEGGFLILEGQARLTEEQSGMQAQVLVRLFQDAAATQALKTADATYSLPDGSMVAVSQIQSGNRPLLSWQARIPLALLPKGGIWLKPVLYIDHFGVATGNPVKRK